MMTLSGEEIAALTAYSEGKTGWRAACRSLRLMDIDELHALLEAQGLPLPPVEAFLTDDGTAARFSAFLRGE